MWETSLVKATVCFTLLTSWIQVSFRSAFSCSFAAKLTADRTFWATTTKVFKTDSEQGPDGKDNMETQCVFTTTVCISTRQKQEHGKWIDYEKYSAKDSVSCNCYIKATIWKGFYQQSVDCWCKASSNLQSNFIVLCPTYIVTFDHHFILVIFGSHTLNSSFLMTPPGCRCWRISWRTVSMAMLVFPAPVGAQMRRFSLVL